MTIIGAHHSASRAPTVSIGMPVRNGERFIRAGIESILAQTYTDFELLITDNASTDDTRTICEEYARRDARIRYHRNPEDLGLQGNFARVLALATGSYFMWACHDDQWDPSYVAAMVDVLDRDSSVVLAGSNAASIDQDGLTRASFDNVAVYARSGTAARALRFIQARPGDGHATLVYGLMRTPVIQAVGYEGPGEIRDAEKGYYFAIDSLTVFRLLFEGEFHVHAATLYYRRDVVVAKVRGSGSGARLGLRRIPRVVQKLRDVHGYYRDLRTIIEASDLVASQKDALIRATYKEELTFYPDYGMSLLARRVGRQGAAGRR